jgi:hypothetical protein
MRNNKALFKEEALNRGISRYLLGRESLSAGFSESRFSEEPAIPGYFEKKVLIKTYAEILDLNNLKKATTTLKNSESEGL